MLKHKTIDIIGSGINGLSTAYYINKYFNDIHIRVWEKDSCVGGLARSITIDGITVEKYYHHFFRKDIALQQLIKECGLQDNLIWRNATTGNYYVNKPYRLSSPVDLLKFDLLPFFDRIRAGYMVLHARNIKDWRKLDTISAKEYIIKVAGEKVYKIIWEPLLIGKFGKYSENISAAWLWSKLVDRGGSRTNSGFEILGYLKGSMNVLFDSIINKLKNNGHEIFLNNPIKNLVIENNKVSSIEINTSVIKTDFVVSCVQIPDLCKIIPQAPQNYLSQLQTIEYLGNVTLILLLNKSLSKFYWTNVMDTSCPFVGIIEQTNWADISHYNNQHIVYISSYILHNDKRLTMTAEELFEFYKPYITKLFSDFKTTHIIKMKKVDDLYAQPIVHKGYNNIIPAIQTPINNLLLCSMAQIYPNDRQLSNGVLISKKTVDILKQLI